MKKTLLMAIILFSAMTLVPAFAEEGETSSSGKVSKARESGFQKVYNDLASSPASTDPAKTATTMERGSAAKGHTKLFKLGQHKQGEVM